MVLASLLLHCKQPVFLGGFFYNLQPFNTFVHFQCVDCEAEAEVEAEVQDIPSSVNRLVAPQTGAKLS